MKQASGLSLPSPADFALPHEITRLSDEDWERVGSLYKSLDDADRVEWLRRCLGTMHHGKRHIILAAIESGIGLTSGDVND